MKGFVGFLLGASLASAGWYYFVFLRPAVPERAEEARVEPATEPAAPKRIRRARRRARQVVENPNQPGGSDSTYEEEVPQRQLTAAELRPQARGDNLSRPDVLHLDMGSGDELPELEQSDIDDRFRARQEAILDCIETARPDPSTYVPGQVSIQFRIQRNGQVRGVRVEAPAILQQGGLYGCVKDVVMGLKFPASRGSQVVTYPFALS